MHQPICLLSHRRVQCTEVGTPRHSPAVLPAPRVGIARNLLRVDASHLGSTNQLAQVELDVLVNGAAAGLNIDGLLAAVFDGLQCLANLP